MYDAAETYRKSESATPELAYANAGAKLPFANCKGDFTSPLDFASKGSKQVYELLQLDMHYMKDTYCRNKRPLFGDFAVANPAKREVLILQFSA